MQNFATLINNPGFIKKVQYILIGLFLCLLGLDIYLALDSADGNTVSNIIQKYTDNGLFVLTYFWGAIAANLFYTAKKPLLVGGTAGTLIIIVVALIVIFLNVEEKVNSLVSYYEYDFSIYFISMLFGFLMGLLFWRQKHK